MTIKTWTRNAICLCGLLLMGSTAAQALRHFAPRRSLAPMQTVDRLIVHYRALPAAATQSPAQIKRMSTTALVPLSFHHAITDSTHVLRLPNAMTLVDAQIVAQRLARDPNVLSAEPDYRLQLNAVPNDPLYPQQWALNNKLAGINVESAWAVTQGDPKIVMAVLDSGILETHPDLRGRLLPGFNFVSDPVAAGNRVGRDASPADTGDFCQDGNPNDQSDSDWHGSHVAGIMGARTGNGVGTAGINPRSMILPVRVIGRCGGAVSDTLAGILWAVGLPVTGAPVNPHPARVLNLSLGATNDAPCSPEIQRAITEAYNRNAAVVVAAGNDNIDASRRMPANCQHVITVAAVTAKGGRATPADWGGGHGSNFGTSVTISAPGDNILSTINTGLTTPAQSAWGFLSGTSQATPQVAGVLSLMLSVNPRLTPDQLKNLLIRSRRPFPAGANCQGICQAGLLDAGRAIRLAQASLSGQAGGTKSTGSTGRLLVSAGANQTVRPGARVTLLGSASATAPDRVGAVIWQQTSGVHVTLSNSRSTRPTFIAPAQPGKLVFRLTATDSQQHSMASSTLVTVSTSVAGASGRTLASVVGR